jgi:hypothetical protein
VETIPCVKRKADWALRPAFNICWAPRCVRSCWGGLIPGLTFSNELISRDQGCIPTSLVCCSVTSSTALTQMLSFVSTFVPCISMITDLDVTQLARHAACLLRPVLSLYELHYMSPHLTSPIPWLSCFLAIACPAKLLSKISHTMTTSCLMKLLCSSQNLLCSEKHDHY